MPALKFTATLSLVALLGGCSTFDQIANVGQTPKLSSIDNPTTQKWLSSRSNAKPFPILAP